MHVCSCVGGRYIQVWWELKDQKKCKRQSLVTVERVTFVLERSKCQYGMLCRFVRVMCVWVYVCVVLLLKVAQSSDWALHKQLNIQRRLAWLPVQGWHAKSKRISTFFCHFRPAQQVACSLARVGSTSKLCKDIVVHLPSIALYYQ